MNKALTNDARKIFTLSESELAQTATQAGVAEPPSRAEIKAGNPAVPIDWSLVRALKLWQKEAAAGDIIGFAAVALCKNGTPVVSMHGLTSLHMAEDVRKLGDLLITRLGDCLGWDQTND